MPFTASFLLHAVVLGVGASLLMDAWNLVLKRAFGIPSLNYAMLGRWVLHMPEGTFVHAGIGTASPKPGERAAGWAAHFSIGILLALTFLFLAPGDWLAKPTMPPALLFGFVTVIFPLFVLQPALGLGFASAKSPHPARARIKSVGTHLVFGLGLYVSALGLRLLG